MILKAVVGGGTWPEDFLYLYLSYLLFLVLLLSPQTVVFDNPVYKDIMEYVY